MRDVACGLGTNRVLNLHVAVKNHALGWGWDLVQREPSASLGDGRARIRCARIKPKRPSEGLRLNMQKPMNCRYAPGVFDRCDSGDRGRARRGLRGFLMTGGGPLHNGRSTAGDQLTGTLPSQPKHPRGLGRLGRSHATQHHGSMGQKACAGLGCISG